MAAPVAAPAVAPTVTAAPTRAAAPASSRPGKRAARPEPKRARTTRTLAPARTAPARVSRAAVEQTPTIASHAAAPSGPVRVATSSTEILSPATGKRRAVRTSSGTRSALLKRLPSAPILAGVAALAVSTGGAVTVAGPTIADSTHSASSELSAASTISGAGAGSEILAERTEVVSRDSNRVEAQKATEAKLVAQAEKAAAQRSKTLETITVQAERQADKIEANLWVMPVEGYRLSATYGSVSGLWASSHTGLDFAAPAGTPLRAVANGTITEVGYDGSYGNKTVLTLEDGTEIWYCHQTSMHVSVGDQVVGGETIGTVGSTGNSTGPHLHLEVRPGGGDHVNPYSALLEHGLQP
ncbi:peptidoglycan DD-metalloendopeptidase family protein [Nocardioides campestrisoli]|uniref:peptidoglycan DD-metalloendopeptidase family protein n=1 Tax=Nocardioides campestrisoli TaxID=2736757 RepID=UPI001C6382CA|nr:peptidoglycan DD-metalloendopeptidase family protein [Nocardioides campestrisoli]